MIPEIFRDNFGKIKFVSSYERRVIHKIINCRTEFMGSRLQRCDHCHVEKILHNSCGNRNCMICQSERAARWVNARVEELLPVSYFHLVFTVPKQLRLIFLYNKTLMYNILFKCQSKTLLKVLKNKFGTPGFLSVLHTWNQKLDFHPHVHTVMAGGGLSSDKTKWISSRKNYLIPKQILSEVFRGMMLFYLNKVFKKGMIRFPAKLKYMETEKSFISICNGISKKYWNVYAKKPFGGPQKVLKYLSRYTHKVGISNKRIVSYDGNKVTFKYRDRADGNTEKIMSLPKDLFIQKFMMHILPRKFVKIRFYGFLSNKYKKENIELIKNIIGMSAVNLFLDLDSISISDYMLCPFCRKGYFVNVKSIDSS